MSLIHMKNDDVYGVCKLPKPIFNQLDKYYFISHCTHTTKYMCANADEKRHLQSLGIKVVDCDYYKLELE